MTGHTEPTTTDDAINTLLEHGLAEGLPRIRQSRRRRQIEWLRR